MGPIEQGGDFALPLATPIDRDLEISLSTWAEPWINEGAWSYSAPIRMPPARDIVQALHYLGTYGMLRL